MTVSSKAPPTNYNGDGSTTVFATEFRFLANSHVQVYLRDAAGNQVQWVENTQYTLTGADQPSGGTVTVKTTPTDYTPQAGERLTILRLVPETQETDYVENDPFPAETHERALDKLTMIDQDQSERLDRSFSIPETDPIAGEQTVLPPAQDRRNKDFQFGDLGEPIMVEPTDASGTAVTTTGTTTARQLAERFAVVIDPVDDGADVSGATDSTEAFHKAWARYKAAANYQSVSGSLWQDIKQAVFYIPPGDFQFNPETFGALDPAAGMAINIAGSGMHTTRVRLTGNGYLFDTTQFLNSVLFEGLTVDGGKGAFRHANAGANVSGYHIFQNLILLGYSECGIGLLSNNQPRVIAQRVFFEGTDTSKGLVIPQQVRDIKVTNCLFRRNKYHMVIPLNQAAMTIGPRNAYLRNGGGPVAADVWLVGINTGIDNSGRGLRFFGDQFSNENYDGSDFRVLIAEAGAGADLIVQDHAITDAGGFWCYGVEFDKCAFWSVGDASTNPNNRSMVHSYLSRVNYFTMRNPDMIGGWFPYFLEFESGVTPTNFIGTARNKVIDPKVMTFNSVPLPCNVPGAVRLIRTDDTYSGHPDQPAQVQDWDLNYADAMTDPDPNSWALAGTGGTPPTKVPVTDSLGGAFASELTFVDTLGRTQGNVTEANLAIGELGWLELDVKAGSATTLDSIEVSLSEETTAPQHDMAWERVPVTADWRRVRIPFRPWLAPAGMTFRVRAGNFYSATKTKVQIGRPALYKANAPLSHPRPVGGTATLANGTTSIVVTHGLNYTPAAQELDVHPIQDWGAAAKWWVDTITATQFTIRVNADPTQDVDFAWSYRRLA